MSQVSCPTCHGIRAIVAYSMHAPRSLLAEIAKKRSGGAQACHCSPASLTGEKNLPKVVVSLPKQ